MGKNKKILVTGLCFSNNQGGPAMALSFMEQIRKYLSPDFVFAVSPVYFNLEKKWADHYGVKIVSEKTKEYKEALKNCDCLVNLNGIAFVGDKSRKWYSSFYENRFFREAKKYKKPFFRFIQSYGPFEDWRVRFIAKREFDNLPCVMARGDLSAQYCRSLTNTPVYSFPDVAITLKATNKRDLGNYIVFCPSAVTARENREKYILFFKDLIKYYKNKGEKIILLPSAFSSEKSKCDRELSKEINNAYIIEEELDCRELKEIIQKSKLAIVSRYHSLVAALSSGVPVISIGWNDKYKDIMKFYNCSEFALDIRDEIGPEMVIKKVDAWTNDKKLALKKQQPKLELKLDLAFRIFIDWLEKIS